MNNNFLQLKEMINTNIFDLYNEAFLIIGQDGIEFNLSESSNIYEETNLNFYINEKEEIEEIAKAVKIEDIKKISKNSKKVQRKIDQKRMELKNKTGIETENLEEIAQRHLGKGLKEGFAGYFKDVIKENNTSLNALKSIGGSFILVWITTLVTSFISLFLAIHISSTLIVGFLIAVLIAPIIEEGGKFFSIKMGFGNTFAATFNITEYLNYVVPSLIAPLPLLEKLKFMLIRVPALFMHTITTVVQTVFRKSGKPKLGYGAGVAIHSLFNFLVSFTTPDLTGKEVFRAVGQQMKPLR